jgi:hypothetical protein
MPFTMMLVTENMSSRCGICVAVPAVNTLPSANFAQPAVKPDDSPYRHNSRQCSHPGANNRMDGGFYVIS